MRRRSATAIPRSASHRCGNVFQSCRTTCWTAQPCARSPSPCARSASGNARWVRSAIYAIDSVPMREPLSLIPQLLEDRSGILS